jgi:IS605 OrfB family transposase
LTRDIDKLKAMEGQEKEIERLFKIRRSETEKRNRFFESEWDKLSADIVRILKKKKVGQLVISRNLAFAKREGELKFDKKTKQKFFMMPFTRLLNIIEDKCLVNGISVVDIDEAYTSKTSCTDGDVNKNQYIRNMGGKPLATDLNGSRVKGTFKNVTGVHYHADVNGAVNHVIVAVDRVRVDLKNNLKKLCNPIKIKSANGLSDYLKGC